MNRAGDGSCYNLAHEAEALGPADPTGRPKEGCRGPGRGPKGYDRQAEAEQARLEPNTPLLRWRELSKNRHYANAEPVECFEEIPSFSDAYKRGEAGLEIHIRVRPLGRDVNARYFIANLQRVRRLGRDDADTPVLFNNRRNTVDKVEVVRPNVTDLMGHRINKFKYPVLIRVRDFAEAIEEVLTDESRGGIERLELFEFIGVGRQHEFPVRRRKPFGFVVHDGELDFPGLRFRGRDTVKIAQGQLPCEVVERGSEVVNRVSDDQAPVVAHLYEAVHAINNCPLISLELSPEGHDCRVTITGVRYFSEEITDVVTRAVKLRPASC